MIKKKICLLGGSAVGKTSLISRYVHSIFSDKYLSTLGVKIDIKSMSVNEQDLELLIWDVHGDEDCRPVYLNYLRGASGYLLVIDGTRPETLERALKLKDSVDEKLGDIPFILLLNKADLVDDWKITGEKIQELEDLNWSVLRSSAKTGAGVEEAFALLAKEILNDRQ